MSDGFISATRKAELTGQLSSGNPMSPVYIAPEDAIICTVYNVAPVAEFELFGRLLRADGVTVPLEQQLRLTRDGTNAFTVITLAEGYLLSAGVTLASGVNQRGETYAIVSLLRGMVVYKQQYARLTTGYVTALQPLMWPWAARNEGLLEGSGYIEARTFTGATGADVTVTVPLHRTWRLKSVTYTLTTSAVAANRIAFLSVRIGGIQVLASESNYSQAASGAHTYTWSTGLAAANPAGFLLHTMGLGNELILKGGDTIVLGAWLVDAGDVFENIVVMVESYAAWP